MAAKLQTFPGMDDILPGEVEKWQWLEERARIFYETRGYREVRTPLLEPTELFTRSIGESSDIVHKEMYTFDDRGGRSMTLRPEMTASVARCVIQHGLLKTSKSLRLYYAGPMFRAERPQAGRKRQFHQFGSEIVNEGDLETDLELIINLFAFLKWVGVPEIKLRMNDLSMISGPQGDDVRKRLAGYFRTQAQVLCKDCTYRLEKNVLRIFDCKSASCQPAINAAPWEDFAPLSEGFERLRNRLVNAYQIPLVVDRRLVRGLDYYTGIVFEVVAEGLGAQNAVAGGGRYDRLYEELGGGPVPCTGFSLGMERLLMTLEKAVPSLDERIREKYVYFAPLIENDYDNALAIHEFVYCTALELRQAGFRAEAGRTSGKLADHLKKANKMGARYVAILGPDEWKQGVWTLKNMDKKEQQAVPHGQLVSYMKGTPSV